MVPDHVDIGVAFGIMNILARSIGRSIAAKVAGLFQDFIGIR